MGMGTVLTVTLTLGGAMEGWGSSTLYVGGCLLTMSWLLEGSENLDADLCGFCKRDRSILGDFWARPNLGQPGGRGRGEMNLVTQARSGGLRGGCVSMCFFVVSSISFTWLFLTLWTELF
jgi:hypothetical protein